MFFNFLPEKPKIIEKKNGFIIIEINKLYPGYGTTIGNSLRRILLSSLEGAAITQVKIKSNDKLILHEFSTISGILEDVITIIQNLKQLRFEILEDTENIEDAKIEYLINLKAKGEKVIKGSDFKIPSQIKLINKNQEIATITNNKTDLEIEAKIKKGIGYESVEARGKEKKEVGIIAIDAIFTPIKRVTFKVENVRVGKRTDFDRLLLEIETDQTINPKKAFLQAVKILQKHLELFEEIN